MSGELTLVLGGARSGKSRWAEALAVTCGPHVLYLATAEARDAEMVERVRRHRERRPASWQTLEAPLDLLGALRDAGGNWDAILLDCLSIWLSNLVLTRLTAEGGFSAPEAEAAEADVLAALDDLLAWRRSAGAALIVVSDEVGQGVVPAYPLGRLYRDLLGLANQRLAAEAERVYYLVAGLGLDLKALGATPFPLPAAAVQRQPHA